MKAKDSLLVYSPNWLGDVVMALPALQAFHKANPDVAIGVVCKKGVAALWQYCKVPVHLHVFGSGARELWRVSREIARCGYSGAILAAHTPRAAILAFLSGVPRRRAFARWENRLFLTDPVVLPEGAASLHQSAEYGFLFGLPNYSELPPAKLFAPVAELPPDLRSALEHGAVVLIPGAKRGPAKQWPQERFVAVGQELLRETAKSIIVVGDPSEEALCGRIAAAIGRGAVSGAGRTSFAQWLTILALSHCVICNDSGGMHVAAALGVPVVAIFGITDPRKTGPLSPLAVVLQNSEIRSREVPRESIAAVQALARITPERVCEAVRESLNNCRDHVSCKGGHHLS